MSRYIPQQWTTDPAESFPYTVIDTATGERVNDYTDRHLADEVADRLNTGYQPTSIYDVDEVAEMMPPTSCPWLPHDTASLDPDTAYHACRNYYGF